MNLLNSMPYIPLFKKVIWLLAFSFYSSTASFGFATQESFEELDKRLSIYPPTNEDYLPVIEAVGSQLEALRQNSIDRAYFFYTSKDFKEETSLPAFKLFLRENQVFSNNKSITLIKVMIDKNIGYYTGIISSKDGETRTVNYQLIYENDAWKILGIQLSN